MQPIFFLQTHNIRVFCSSFLKSSNHFGKNLQNLATSYLTNRLQHTGKFCSCWKASAHVQQGVSFRPWGASGRFFFQSLPVVLNSPGRGQRGAWRASLNPPQHGLPPQWPCFRQLSPTWRIAHPSAPPYAAFCHRVATHTTGGSLWSGLSYDSLRAAVFLGLSSARLQTPPRVLRVP